MATFTISLTGDVDIGDVTQSWDIDPADMSDVVATLARQATGPVGPTTSPAIGVAKWQQRVFLQLMNQVKADRVTAQAKQLQTTVVGPKVTEVSVVDVSDVKPAPAITPKV